MNAKYILLAAVAGVFSFSAVPVQADHHGEGKKGGKMFEKVDTNGDGVVSKEEFMSAHEKMFAKMDKNDDGSLSKEEMQEHRATMKDKWKNMKDKKKSMGEGE